ncbi:GNAT family N-acetyltransferase [Streptosporangium lutulentum]|uniref:GNAT superfamily N-acetyltransferase n=1 Tax=Streptosporangium lutulentum TaxID=1461250 RepID=A0ABT9QJZ8_9ACTN|nr:GNAT family N-acetyltransferase [Streptosporangium lutulentum]MDP9847034.1 GNAT superfamily N-acetyltransferase [Streptosporangium lutulentum]
MITLPDVLTAAAGGQMPRPGAGPTIVPQPSARDAGVIAFTAHNVIFADLDEDWIRSRLPDGDLSAPLNPPFLKDLEERMGRQVTNIDMLALATPCAGHPPIELTEVTDRDHPRVERARRYRDDVRVWTCPGGLLVIGRGVAGRWEVAIEVDPAVRGHGLGRTLARAARHLTVHPLWAQIAPGNAASVRAFLSAGYVPIGAEALLVPPSP